MIVRMSKVEIAGPKELLLDVLEIIREQGVLQPEMDLATFGGQAATGDLRSLILDERTAGERLFLDHLQQLTSTILPLLPPVEVRDCHLDPHTLLESIAASAERHLTWCRQWRERHDTLDRERSELDRHAVLLGAIEGLIGESEPDSTLEFIGITLREPALSERLREVLARITGGAFSLTTTLADDGTLIGLIAAPAAHGARIKQLLSREQLPELPAPAALRELPLPERIRRVREQSRAAAAEIATIDVQTEEITEEDSNEVVRREYRVVVQSRDGGQARVADEFENRESAERLASALREALGPCASGP